MITITLLTEALYTGAAGNTYAFYSIAFDNVGNLQLTPTTPQASTTVAGGNTPPILATNTGLTLNEATTGLISTSQLQVTDLNNSSLELIYTLTDLPDNGTLLLNNQPLTIENTFTQADIDNNLFSYQHNGSETISDNFSFTVSDGVGGELEVTTFNFTISPINDAPVATDDTATTSKNTPLAWKLLYF